MNVFAPLSLTNPNMITSFVNWLLQIASITRFSLLSVPARKGSAAAAVFGIAGVVAVLVGVLSIAQGFRHAMIVAGDPNTVMVLRSGSDSEMTSILIGDETRIIADASGVARTDAGALASAELFVVINLPKRSTGTDANVPLRGVGPAAFQVRRDLRLVAGRRFESGRNEIIVGRGAAREFAGLEIGAKLEVGPNQWTVVGVFAENGGISESEIWTDASVLQTTYRRGNSFQSVYAKLASFDAFAKFKETLANDPRLNVKVLRQTDFYAEQSILLYNMITVLGYLIATLMAIGAIFGALNTMYTAVSARTSEIATLRALGFGGEPVVISILIESLLLAILGGALGGGLAYVVFDGFYATTINWQSFSQVAFAFDVSPQLLLQGIIGAVLIGLIGGLFPAIRAARLPVATALREL
jgi:putative ABC transport system permease protein